MPGVLTSYNNFRIGQTIVGTPSMSFEEWRAAGNGTGGFYGGDYQGPTDEEAYQAWAYDNILTAEQRDLVNAANPRSGENDWAGFWRPAIIYVGSNMIGPILGGAGAAASEGASAGSEGLTAFSEAAAPSIGDSAAALPSAAAPSIGGGFTLGQAVNTVQQVGSVVGTASTLIRLVNPPKPPARPGAPAPRAPLPALPPSSPPGVRASSSANLLLAAAPLALILL